MGKSRVDQYLEDRKKRLEEEKRGSAGTISGKSEAVQNYIAQREKEGRTYNEIKKGASSFNTNKKNYGIGFEPSYDRESFAREYAARRLQNTVTPVKSAISTPIERDTQKPYTKTELESMVTEFRRRNSNTNQSFRNDPYTRDEYIIKGADAKNPEIGNNPIQNFKMLYNTPFGNPIKNKVEYAFDEMEKRENETRKLEEQQNTSPNLFGIIPRPQTRIKAGEDDPNYKKNVEPYMHMSESERDEYNFLFGKYGELEADKYLKGLRNTLNAREAESQYQELDNRKILNKTNKTLASFGSQNKEAIMNMTKGAAAMLTGKGANENEISVDDYLASMIQNNAEGGEQLLYQVAGSIGNMVPSMQISMLNPAAGKFAFGLSAAGGAYEGAISEGKNIDKAQDYALFSGIAETMTQALLGGISGLSGKYLQKAVAKSGAAQAAQEGMRRLVSNQTARKVIMGTANYAGDMASEGMEEYIQELMDKSARNILFDENNEIKLTDPDAWYAALMGSVTAGVLNAPGAYANAVTEHQTMKNDNSFVEPQEEQQKIESMEEPELLQVAREFAAMNGVETVPGQEPEIQRMDARKGPETAIGRTGEEIYEVAANRQETPVNHSNDREQMKELFTSIGEFGQKAAADNYAGNVEMIDYQTAFNRYYDAGRYNADMQAAERAAITAILTPEQANAALKAGMQDRNIALNQKPTYKAGQAKEGKMVNNASGALKEQKRFAKAMGKKTGLTFILESDLESGAIGEYDSKAGTVRISTNSKNYLQTNSHELTHFIKDYDAEGYNRYKEAVVTALLDAENVSLEQLVTNYESSYTKQGQQLSRDEILDEIVADGTGQFLNDEQFISRVIEKDRTIAQKVIDFLSDMIDAIKSLISDKGIRAAAVGLQENLSSYELARELWVESLESASEKYKSGMEKIDAEGVKFSVKEAEDGTKYVEADIEQEQFDGLNHKEKLKIAEQVVMSKFRNKVIGESPNNAFVKRDTGKEYRNPAKFLNEQQADAKARVSTELDSLMSTAQFVGHYDDDGRHQDIIGGWDHYSAKFKVGGTMFEGIISVGITKNGRVFKDLTKIKNISQGNSDTANASNGSNDSTGDVLKSTASGKAGQKAAGSLADSASGISNNSIAKTQENIKDESKKLLYQLEDVDINVSVDVLLDENRTLREANEYLTKQLTLTKDYKPREDDINKVANKLLSDYNSTMKKETLIKQLTKLYEYIRSSENIDGREVTEAATAIAKTVLNNSKQKDTELADRYRTVLKDIKETPIMLSESQRQELDAVGGYNTFRKKYFGELRLGNAGIDVDTAYDELSGKYPELFPAEIINTDDQLLQIANVVDSLRPQIVNPYKADIDKMSYMVGQQIFDNYFDIRNVPPTKADRMATDAERVKREYARLTNRYKAQVKNRYNQRLNEVHRELRQAYQKTEQTMEIKYQEKVQARLEIQRERTQSAKLKQQIMKETKELSRILLKPTDKKHVPEALRGPLAKFLSGIDFSSNQKGKDGEGTERTRAWNALKEIYGEIEKNSGILESKDKKTSIYIDLDPDLSANMKALNNAVENIDKLENLSSWQLRNLYEVVRGMKNSIAYADKMRRNRKFNSIKECGKSAVTETMKRSDKEELAGKLGIVEDMLQKQMLDSGTFFNRLGPSIESAYQGIRNGLDQKIRLVKTAQDYIGALMNGITRRDLREWRGKRATVKSFEVSGGIIEMTPAQVMSLYVLNKREQAKGHIYNQAGGIKTAPRVEVVKTLKGIKTKEVIKKGTKPVSVTPFDVNNIIKTLTPRQKDIADGIAEFLTTYTSEWGNEASLEIYGYKKFQAKNYFPIKTDKNYIATRTADIERGTQTIKNYGATKDTTRGAKNPIIIEDIFDVYTRHVNQMSSYNAFLVPLSDFQKLYNLNDPEIGNIKQEIERVYGTGAQRYIERLLKDINGTGSDYQDVIAPLVRNMKAASVGFNLRTAIQQPTSYIRALAEIDGKYLMKGAQPHVSDKEWELCKHYAPIAQWKDWGNFDINTGRTMQNIIMGPQSLKESVIDLSMELAGKADEFTWRRLWMSVRAETEDLHPELAADTEAYYQQCGKRFSEIIDRTQVVDSVLHRSALMKNPVATIYTSFMSEPTKSFNMLFRAWGDAIVSKDKNGKMDTKLKNRALAVTGVWGLTGFTTALAAAIVDALRDDNEDKELWDKYLEAVAGNVLDNLNPMGMIPILRDIQSQLNGFSVNRIDMQGFQYFIYANGELQKYVNGESKYTLAGMLNKFVKPISLFSGVAASSLTRDISAVLNTAIDSFGFDTLDYEKEKWVYRLDKTENLTLYVKEAMRAYLAGKDELGDRIIRELKEAGIDTDDIVSKQKAILKSSPEVEEAAAALVKGDLIQYTEGITEIMDVGYNRETAVSVIQSAVNQKTKNVEVNTIENETDKEDKEEKKKEVYLYQAANIRQQLDAENIRAAQAIAQELYIEKKKAGETGAKARGEIKKSLTGYYKKSYLASDREGRYKIQVKLEKISLDGAKLYEDKDFTEWIEKYQKEKKKK